MRIALIFILIVVVGCSSSSVAPVTFSSYSIHLSSATLPPAPTSETYMLWVRFVGDSTLHGIPLPVPKFSQSVWNYSGSISLQKNPDSIVRASLSLEHDSSSTHPTATLLAGTIESSSGTLTSDSAIGNYSKSLATATFTTRSGDTTLDKNEFYLLRFANSTAVPASTLPEAPAGWSYGLWVLDSNFYPLHRFFYGAFTNSDSADLQADNTDYPFPGGFNPAPLNDPGALLEITLEPLLAASNKPTSPSPIIILEHRLSTVIDLNDTLALTNVWIPISATVTFQ